MGYIVHSGMPPNEPGAKSNELDALQQLQRFARSNIYLIVILSVWQIRLVLISHVGPFHHKRPRHHRCVRRAQRLREKKQYWFVRERCTPFRRERDPRFPCFPGSLTMHRRLKQEFAWYGGTSATLGACDENVTFTVSEAILSPDTGSKSTISLRPAPLRCFALMESICFPALLPLVSLV